MPQTFDVSSPTAAGSYAPAAPFLCTLTTGGTRAAWIHVAGELDLVTSPQLKRTLRTADLHARLVVLDAREVTFIDSAGVHVILDASKNAEWGEPGCCSCPALSWSAYSPRPESANRYLPSLSPRTSPPRACISPNRAAG